ncbi:MAG: hypothetical protein AAGA23_15980 [Pseudomonadota bacterium]
MSSKFLCLTGLALSLVAGGASAQTTVTITDPDPSASEPGDTARVRFERAGTDLSAPLVVQYLLEGEALPSGSGRDYETDPVGTNLGFGRLGITIPANETFQDLLITPLADNRAEGDESIVVRIDADAAYLVGVPDQATVTLIDDPAVITISTIMPAADEAGPISGLVRFERAGGDLSGDLVIQYLLEGEATPTGASTDYVTDPAGVNLGFGRLGITIPGGSAERGMTLTPLADNRAEGTETAVVRLDADSAYNLGASDRSSITIEDDAPVLTIQSGDAQASERGPDPGSVTLTRSGGDPGADLTARIRFEGTATSDDYEVTPELLSLGFGTFGAVLPAGNLQLELQLVPAADARENEGEETVIVQLRSSDAYIIEGPPEAQIAIEDFVEAVFQDGFESLSLKNCDIGKRAELADHFHNNHGSLLDLLTGLEWARCGLGFFFKVATGECQAQAEAASAGLAPEEMLEQFNAGFLGDNHGFQNWRFASAAELKPLGLADQHCAVRSDP